jgi:hypothetical protein
VLGVSCTQIENAVLQKAGELQRQRREDEEDAAGDAAGDVAEGSNRGASADRAGRSRDEGGAAGGAADAAGVNESKGVPDVVRFDQLTMSRLLKT